MPLKYGLIDPIDLPLPRLPQALEGLRIAHLSDLHVRGPSQRLDRLSHQLAPLRVDLVCFTGDYMIRKIPASLDHAVDAIRKLVEPLRPAIGVFGVFGNHDDDELVERVKDFNVRWLLNERVQVQGRPLEILGLHARRGGGGRDAVDLLLQPPVPYDPPHAGPAPGGWPRMAAGRRATPAARLDPSHFHEDSDRPLRLMLAHHPQSLMTAHDLDADLLLAGHTHGGQIRLPGGRAMMNSTDLPLRFSSGLLRSGHTLAAISRGLGETALPIRFLCPPHVPLYTLRRKPLPTKTTDDICVLQRW